MDTQSALYVFSSGGPNILLYSVYIYSRPIPYFIEMNQHKVTVDIHHYKYCEL